MWAAGGPHSHLGWVPSTPPAHWAAGTAGPARVAPHAPVHVRGLPRLRARSWNGLAGRPSGLSRRWNPKRLPSVGAAPARRREHQRAWCHGHRRRCRRRCARQELTALWAPGCQNDKVSNMRASDGCAFAAFGLNRPVVSHAGEGQSEGADVAGQDGPASGRQCDGSELAIPGVNRPGEGLSGPVRRLGRRNRHGAGHPGSLLLGFPPSWELWRACPRDQ